jgi:hypothetical protein
MTCIEPYVVIKTCAYPRNGIVAFSGVNRPFRDYTAPRAPYHDDVAAITQEPCRHSSSRSVERSTSGNAISHKSR